MTLSTDIAPMPAWPSKSVSSYCTQGGCPLEAMQSNAAALNSFSITSYYVSLAGDIEPCNSAYGACNWTGDVSDANEQRQQTSGVHAQVCAWPPSKLCT
jgi:hypothetical protein